MKIKLGLIVNPVAGVGGSVALKGSDHVVSKAVALGATPKAGERTAIALSALQPYQDKIELITAPLLMGENVCQALGLDHTCITFNSEQVSADITDYTARHTREAAAKIKQQGVDCLIFAGGDGTARDIYSVVGDDFPVLGVPAGVKIHSGVYAITPHSAGKVLELIMTNQLVSLMTRGVMDIDETLFRQGIVRAKNYGEMLVPAELNYMQSVKMGGVECDELVLTDIAADVIRQIDDSVVVMGSGSTTAFIMQELGLNNTLLGVDIIDDGNIVANDVSEQQLYSIIDSASDIKLVLTLIGGQGHIFGRGNQQLSPRIIRRIGKDNIIIVATKTKLEALAHRRLLVDTGDLELDRELSGLVKVTTGYHDYVMIQIDNPQ